MEVKENVEKSSRFAYTVEPFTEDFTGMLAWSELGKRILAAAGMHADSHGFGMKQLLPRNMAWVLSRMNVEMQEMPKKGEQYLVETWVHSIYRTFTDRCFAILRPDGTAFGYAYTTWALINTETRMPTNLENLPNGGFSSFVDAEKVCNTSAFSRIRVNAVEPANIVTALYSDIDINMHVNSIRYVEHIFDLFPMDFFKEHRVWGLEIAYHGEAHYGERLALYKQPAADGICDVDVRVLPGNDDAAKERRACSCRVKYK
jgi:medium-chain acyl-[acyl-carrier-protein] hydrolase